MEDQITMDELQKILIEAKWDSKELHVECKSSDDNLNNLKIQSLLGGGYNQSYKSFTAIGHGDKMKFVEITNILAIEYNGKRFEIT